MCPAEHNPLGDDRPDTRKAVELGKAGRVDVDPRGGRRLGDVRGRPLLRSERYADLLAIRESRGQIEALDVACLQRPTGGGDRVVYPRAERKLIQPGTHHRAADVDEDDCRRRRSGAGTSCYDRRARRGLDDDRRRCRPLQKERGDTHRDHANDPDGETAAVSSDPVAQPIAGHASLTPAASALAPIRVRALPHAARGIRRERTSTSCYTLRRMAVAHAARSAARGRVLFVAREPDETLRTFLPIVDCLEERHGLQSRVLFHHPPGEWARSELERRRVAFREYELPARLLPARLLQSRIGRFGSVKMLDEIGRFLHAKALAHRALERERPSAVVVIQDTLLLERFLVRRANRLGIPTLVVQWAFNYTQAMYDRLRGIQQGRPDTVLSSAPIRRRLAPLTGAAYRGLLRALGLSFRHANSYGGGEARLFAVWGEAFKEQYTAQGVRDKRIVVTGHPTHDAAYARAASIDDHERARIRARYRLPPDGPLVLYATQPVLWRRVIGPAELEANVRAIAASVAAVGTQLVLKLHPRERPEDYAFSGGLDPPVAVLTRAEIPDLVAACDVFVSSSSSTVLLAMMLDRPIVTVNFNQVPHFDYFEPLGGALHTRSPAEFTRALPLALSDEPTRARLERERRRVLDRYTRFDGRATERLAGLIVGAVDRSQRRPTLG